jgi:hypothetical protein
LETLRRPGESRYAKATEAYVLVTGENWQDHQYVEGCMARLMAMEGFEKL